MSSSISIFAENLVPDFIVRENPKLVNLLKEYIKYLERYNEVERFNTLGSFDGSYDPSGIGLLYQGIYIDLEYSEDQAQLVKKLSGCRIKCKESNSIYIVDSVVYSDLDEKYLLRVALQNGSGYQSGESVSKIDIGEYTRICDLLLYRDIDDTVEEFISLHEKEFLFGLPSNIASDTRKLIKNIRDFYRSKGTVESYRFLFRALYNSEIEISYPREEILRVSDGKWFQPYIVELTDDNNIFEFENSSVRGSISNVRADVESVIVDRTNVTADTPFVDIPKYLELTTEEGSLLPGETITLVNNEEVSAEIENITLTQGRWLNSDGFISSDKVLQDNFFYQDFSYLITSDVSITEYRNVVEQILHPSGMLLFGEFAAPSETVLTISLDSFISNLNSVSFSDTLGISLENLTFNNLNFGNSEIVSFFDTSKRKLDEDKEEYPWENLFNRNSQYDNVILEPFEINPDEESYLIPDSELTINNNN